MRKVARHIGAWFDAKTLSTLLVALAGLLGTRHEAAVKINSEDDRVTAVASIAVEATERADSLARQVKLLKIEIAVLKARARAVGIKAALAEGPLAPITQQNKPGAFSRFWHGLFH